MKKIYILDTSVLIHDPMAIYQFQDNDLILPIIVLEELDKIKKDNSQKAHNARLAVRELDNVKKEGNLCKGVKIGESGGSLSVELNHQTMAKLPDYLKNSKTNDNRILSVAKEVSEEIKKAKLNTPTILVTTDINLRVKADALGILSEDYKAGMVEIGKTEGRIRTSGDKKIGLQNSFVKDDNGIVRVIGDTLCPIKNCIIWGITSKNQEQMCAFNLLLDDSVKLVAITGHAGTGKTLLTIASGLHKIINEKKYRRLTVTRGFVPMGKDIGYLPGSKDEKIEPWHNAFYDTIDYLSSLQTDKSKKGSEKTAGHSSKYTLAILKEKSLLNIEALTYIRGMSMQKQFIVVDEAQNLTPHEVKTLITRAGEGSKVVLLGDIGQIDSTYLNSENNGLTHVIKKFTGNRIFGHIKLIKSERSELAEIAATIL
jgi:PhoH-like ATPase